MVDFGLALDELAASLSIPEAREYLSHCLQETQLRIGQLRHGGWPWDEEPLATRLLHIRRLEALLPVYEAALERLGHVD